MNQLVDGFFGTTFDPEKFADLIIQECIRLIECYPYQQQEKFYHD